MKKLYILLFISLTTFPVSFGQFTKIGGGLGSSTGFPFHDMSLNANKSGHFNASVKGIFELSLPFHISPSFTIFYPHITKDIDLKTTVSTMMFDLNGHYVFNYPDRFEFYGLAGFDVMIAKKKEVPTYNTPEIDNALGLNIGAGANMKITKQFDLYAEARYVFFSKGKLILSNYNQFLVNAGVMINLSWSEKRENP